MVLPWETVGVEQKLLIARLRRFQSRDTRLLSMTTTVTHPTHWYQSEIGVSRKWRYNPLEEVLTKTSLAKSISSDTPVPWSWVQGRGRDGNLKIVSTYLGRQVGGSILPLPEHFDFPPAVYDWVNKGLGKSSRVCATGHIKISCHLLENTVSVRRL